MNKLIIADSQSIFRSGAAKTLALEDDFRIVAQCADAERLLLALETFRAAIVIFASALRLEAGVVTLRATRADCRAIVILENGETVQPWFSAGVLGAVDRKVTSRGFIDCVRRVGRGEGNVRSEGVELCSTEEDPDGTRVRDCLTPKELKIVGLIAHGCKNREIASLLNTNEQVIKNYLRRIFDKIGVSDRLELALFTIHHRVLAAAAAMVTDPIAQLA
jgi:DNA-binding NarL/FixJ family response regulator